MNTNIITPPIWLQLPPEERRILRDLLKVPRTGGSIVEDNKVISDGCTQNDLNVITVASLQKALDSDDEDFFSLWNQAVSTAKKLAEVKVQEREDEAKRNLEEMMMQDAEARATVFVSTLRRMPTMVQIAVHTQLEALLYPPIVVENNDIKEIIKETNEQTESVSDITGTEGEAKGNKTTKGADKK